MCAATNLEWNVLTFIEMRYPCAMLVCTRDNWLVLRDQLLSDPVCYIIPYHTSWKSHCTNSESPSRVLPILLKFHFRTANLPLTLNYTTLATYPASLCYRRPSTLNWTLLRCFKPVFVILKGNEEKKWCIDFPNRISSTSFYNNFQSSRISRQGLFSTELNYSPLLYTVEARLHYLSRQIVTLRIYCQFHSTGFMLY
jgi:hypothetical protein